MHVGSVFKGLEIIETILIKMEKHEVGKKLLRMTEQAYIKFNIVKQIILSHLHPKREIKNEKRSEGKSSSMKLVD